MSSTVQGMMREAGLVCRSSHTASVALGLPVSVMLAYLSSFARATMVGMKSLRPSI